MTEDEALTKWCPFVRIIKSTDGGTVDDNQAAMNRLDGTRTTPILPDASKCIASACMAWRWHEAKRTDAFVAAAREHMKSQAKPNFNTAIQEVLRDRGDQFEHTEGYCGLAGSIAA